MLNQIVLQGRLCGDPEMKKTQSGVSVISINVACDDDYTAKDGSRHTDFITVVAWRGTADFICKWFHKGDMILVSGRLVSRNWTDKNGGKRTSWEINANSVNFCGSKRDSDSREIGTEKDPEPPVMDEIDDGELPF